MGELLSCGTASGGLLTRWKGANAQRVTPSPLWNIFAYLRAFVQRRISILHGRPVLVSPVEVDVDMPADLAELRPPNRVSNLPNISAAIYLTERLEEVALVM